MTTMALVLTIAAQAQRDTIGVSRFTAIYRYECRTTDADGQPVTDSMYIAVQTSGGITKSFPYEEYDRQKKGGSRIADGYLAAQMHMGTIFTNYPEGRITSQEMLYPYRYMTDEPLEKQNWTLTNAQNTICNYASQSATTKYHGLTWNVYYTEDVPASIGPWKLGGLFKRHPYLYALRFSSGGHTDNIYPVRHLDCPRRSGQVRSPAGRLSEDESLGIPCI